jgi:hypothetical protein
MINHPEFAPKERLRSRRLAVVVAAAGLVAAAAPVGVAHAGPGDSYEWPPTCDNSCQTVTHQGLPGPNATLRSFEPEAEKGKSSAKTSPSLPGPGAILPQGGPCPPGACIPPTAPVPAFAPWVVTPGGPPAVTPVVPPIPPIPPVVPPEGGGTPSSTLG